MKQLCNVELMNIRDTLTAHLCLQSGTGDCSAHRTGFLKYIHVFMYGRQTAVGMIIINRLLMKADQLIIEGQIKLKLKATKSTDSTESCLTGRPVTAERKVLI